jgi:hypothetical protein
VKKPLFAALLCAAAATLVSAGDLSKQEKKKLKFEAAGALQRAMRAEQMAKRARKQGDADVEQEQLNEADDAWRSLSGDQGLLGKLAEANDKGTWKFISKTAARVPPGYGIEAVIRKAAESMVDKGVQAEIRKKALKFKNPKIRRELVLHMANAKEWGVLLSALQDKDEGVASLAAWRLVDNRIEAAVEPLLDLLEKLERNKSGIWDVARNGLGVLLGQRCGSAIEYRSLWEIVKEKGGVSAVAPPKPEERAGGGGEMSSGVRLFGREIDCTRVVFILDVSGSMKERDPGQRLYDDRDPGSRTRKVDGSEAGDGGAASKLKTRLERAQRELKNVLRRLPANFKVNVVAFSSIVSIWRAENGDEPAKLHTLTQKNRKAAMEYVDGFSADGVTATDDAIRRAFSVEGARCFYLLSDGFATHTGKLPGISSEEMCGVVDEYKERHVTIHTLGFQGADVEMMQAIAERTGGGYSDIK